MTTETDPQPVLEPGQARLLLGDSFEVLAGFDACSVDAVVCDPPYEISFNGSAWDSTGVSFDPALWAAAAAALKPGGHLLAFAGARTYHRVAAAIEDAGVEIRDMLAWIYGEAMPKSRDVAALVDEKLGVARDVIGQAEGTDTSATRPGFTGAAHSRVPNQVHTYDVKVATSPEAKYVDGWGTRLKPALEPICMARNPLEGTIAETVLKHGTGGLNVRACAIGDAGGAAAAARAAGVPVGRFPANVLLGHSIDCAGSGAGHTERLCVDGCPARVINEVASRPARFFYIAKPRKRERVGGAICNLHQTVKPVELMRWLVRLVTPPGGVVLDPFMGSGTTGCAAMAEGVRFVGVERDPEYFDLACARVGDWAFAHDRPKPLHS